MSESRAVAGLARALADESRAAMCVAMLDGSAWTLTELAAVADISLPTASEHVSKLVAADILSEERAGRNRYLRLAGPEAAHVLEVITGFAGPPRASATSLRGVGERRRLAAARTCYDHLAGRLGVAMMDALVDRRMIARTPGLTVTARGGRWFADFDIDLESLRAHRRTLLRECPDWTERRPHLAGSLGAALCERMVHNQWVRRPDRTRRLEVTAPGQRALRDLLGITASDLAIPG